MSAYYSIFGAVIALLFASFQQCKSPYQDTASSARADTVAAIVMPFDDCGRELRDSLSAVKQDVWRLESIFNSPRVAPMPGIRKTNN